MSAWPNEHSEVHVKAIGNEAFVIYFEAGVDPEREIKLSPKPGTGRFQQRYTAEWFDPRTGESELWESGKRLDHNWAGDLILPSRPNAQDWVLIARVSRIP